MMSTSFLENSSYVFALRLFDNGDLVSGSGDGTIKIWDVENGSVKKEFESSSTVMSLEELQNGDLVSASDDSIVIWE